MGPDRHQVHEQSGRFARAAELGQQLPLRIELADHIVVVVEDEDVARVVHRQVARGVEPRLAADREEELGDQRAGLRRCPAAGDCLPLRATRCASGDDFGDS